MASACQIDGPPATSSGTPDGSLPAVPVVVEAHEFGFGPAELTIPAVGPITLELLDTGLIPHNLTVDALGIQVVAAAGRSATATLEGLTPGTYEFYCSISGHRQAGMVGTLIVQ